VARASEIRGIRFAAVKAISDASDFVLPPMERFTSPNGQFNTGRFVLFGVARPWMWGTIARLTRNSNIASRALCAKLREVAQSSQFMRSEQTASLEALTPK